MPYTVMIWLVDREHTLSAAEAHRDPHLAPGASSGVTAGPAFDRLNYGFYETEDEANRALEELASTLERNAPVRVENEKRTFLIPASRVHYAVCEEVIRPKDEARATRVPVASEEPIALGV
jgi:hypothetical protein